MRKPTSHTTTRLFAAAALLATATHADVYIHAGPAGSNNRLDEENRERNNANRLFNSQNNNRGGYNVGSMQYYPGEKIQFQWTNQHGSSKYQMEHTELILQYMCEPLMRDGTTTNTIPDKPIDCQNFDCDTDVRFGRHESYTYYQRCKQTERNKGLFTANQNLQGNAAQFTRQSPNGQRHGYECPEEREYYPYWRPTPWKDIAYITNDIERCQKVTAASQNVVGRGWCTLPASFYEDPENELPKNDNGLYPITEKKCNAWRVESKNGTLAGQWREMEAWGLDKPACVQTEQTRANHLGVIGGRQQYTYQYTIPDDIGEQSRCVSRIRYNITTNEYDAWEAPSSIRSGVNDTQSSQLQKPNPGNNPANLDMWSKFRLAESDVKKRDNNGNLVFYDGNNNGDAESREYVFKNNPQVQLIMPSPGKTFPNNFRFKLQLAVNTAQFGRTFQDRSHTWRLRPPASGVPDDAEIKLVTVAGKRGNIVQTFPAHEYFFIPEITTIQQGDFLHFAWQGSNTNPNNNDGQGKQGTDRSNIVPLRVPQYSREGWTGALQGEPVTPGYSDFTWDQDFDGDNMEPVARKGETSDPGTSYPAFINWPEGYDIPLAQYEFQPPYGRGEVTLRENYIPGAFGGLSDSTLAKLATGRQAEFDDFGNMEELDDASTAFDMPPKEVTELGCWNYMSTRNNNFSNRSQKGKICVTENSVESKMIGMNGGEIWTKHGDGVQIWPESLDTVNNIKFSSRVLDDTDLLRVEDVKLARDSVMTLYMRYETKSLHKAKVMHRCLDSDTSCGGTGWEEVEDVEWEERDGSNIAVVNHNMQGEYKVVHETNKGAVAGIVIGSLVFACAILVVIGYQIKTRWLGQSPGRDIDI